jgi:hypothetical protein
LFAGQIDFGRWRLVAEVLENGAVKAIASRFGRQVDHPSVETAEFGSRRIGCDREFVDRVDDG